MTEAGVAPTPPSRTRVGVDVVDVERMRALLERRPAAAERLFSEQERSWCAARKRPWVHLAARFAAKEAVRKALGRACAWSSVEVRRKDGGAPYLALGPLLTADGCRVAGSSVSLTHDGGIAVAVVALEVLQPPSEPDASSGPASVPASR